MGSRRSHYGFTLTVRPMSTRLPKGSATTNPSPAIRGLRPTTLKPLTAYYPVTTVDGTVAVEPPAYNSRHGADQHGLRIAGRDTTAR